MGLRREGGTVLVRGEAAVKECTLCSALELECIVSLVSTYVS